MPASFADLVAVRSQLAEALAAYYRRLIHWREEVSLWHPDGAAAPLIPVRVTKFALPTAVPTGEQPRPARAEDHADGEAGAAARPPAPPPHDPLPRVVLWERERPTLGRAVVLGAPGAGKSSLARDAVAAVARQELQRLNERRTPLDQRLLPIVVPASDLVAAYRQQRERIGEIPNTLSALDVALTYLLALQDPRLGGQHGWVKAALAENRIWLAVDGLDEAGSLDGLDELLGEKAGKWRILLTCRTADSGRYPGLERWPRYGLVPFRPSEVAEFVTAWFDQRPDLGEQLRSLLVAEPTLRAECANPLIATLVCTIHEEGPPLDARIGRSALYARLVPSLLRRQRGSTLLSTGPDAELAPVLELLRDPRSTLLDRMVQLLECLAGTLVLQDGVRSGFPSARVTNALADALQAGPLVDPRLTPELARRILCYRGILTTLDPDNSGDARLSFCHPTLLEYLAAKRLKTQVEQQPPTQLRDGESGIIANAVRLHADDPSWHELFIFLAGQLRDPEPLLAALADPASDDLFRHRLALAARCLPVLHPEDRARLAARIDAITCSIGMLWWSYFGRRGDAAVAHLTAVLPDLGRAGGKVEGLPLRDWLLRRASGEALLPVAPPAHPSDYAAYARRGERDRTRIAAATALRLLADPHPTVLAALRDLTACTSDDILWPDELCKTAVEALGALGDTSDRTIDLFERLAGDRGNAALASAAITALGQVAPASERARTALWRLVESLSPATYAAARALGQVGKDNSRLVAALREHAQGGGAPNQNAASRHLAVAALGELRDSSPETLDLLRRLSDHSRQEDAGLRWQAIMALAKLPDAQQETFDHLLPVAESDPWNLVRHAAVVALGALRARSPETVKLLKNLIRTDDNASVRWAALEALGALGVPLPREAAALLRSLGPSYPPIHAVWAQAAALHDLASAGPEVTATAQRLLARDPDGAARRAALRLLVAVGDRSDSTQRLLRDRRWADPSPVVRAACWRALAERWPEGIFDAQLTDPAQGEAYPAVRLAASLALSCWPLRSSDAQRLEEEAFYRHDPAVLWTNGALCFLRSLAGPPDSHAIAASNRDRTHLTHTAASLAAAFLGEGSPLPWSIAGMPPAMLARFAPRFAEAREALSGLLRGDAWPQDRETRRVLVNHAAATGDVDALYRLAEGDRQPFDFELHTAMFGSHRLPLGPKAGAIGDLLRLAVASDEALRALCRLCQSSVAASEVRRRAVTALGLLGRATPEVVETLCEAADSYAAREDAVQALGVLPLDGEQRERALKILIKHCRNSYGQTKRAAAIALGRQGDGRRAVRRALQQCQSDYHRETRWAAKLALARLAGAGATALYELEAEVAAEPKLLLDLLSVAGDSGIPAARLSRLDELAPAVLDGSLDDFGATRAVGIIASFGADRRVVNALLQIAKDCRSEEIGVAATGALGGLESTREVRAALCQIVASTDLASGPNDRQFAALAALGELDDGSDEESWDQVLVVLFERARASRDERIRQFATAALERIARLFPRVLGSPETLCRYDPAARWAAFAMIERCKLTTAEALEFLRGCVEQRADPELRRAAADLLGRLGASDAPVLAVLRAAAADGDDILLRQAAVEALGDLKAATIDEPSLGLLLHVARGDQDAGVRAVADRASSDTDFFVRAAAVRALGRLAPPPAVVVAALRDLRDGESALAPLAAATLGRLQYLTPEERRLLVHRYRSDLEDFLTWPRDFGGVDPAVQTLRQQPPALPQPDLTIADYYRGAFQARFHMGRDIDTVRGGAICALARFPGDPLAAGLLLALARDDPAAEVRHAVLHHLGVLKTADEGVRTLVLDTLYDMAVVDGPDQEAAVEALGSFAALNDRAARGLVDRAAQALASVVRAGQAHLRWRALTALGKLGADDSFAAAWTDGIGELEGWRPAALAGLSTLSGWSMEAIAILATLEHWRGARLSDVHGSLREVARTLAQLSDECFAIVAEMDGGHRLLLRALIGLLNHLHFKAPPQADALREALKTDPQMLWDLFAVFAALRRSNDDRDALAVLLRTARDLDTYERTELALRSRFGSLDATAVRQARSLFRQASRAYERTVDLMERLVDTGSFDVPGKAAPADAEVSSASVAAWDGGPEERDEIGDRPFRTSPAAVLCAAGPAGPTPVGRRALGTLLNEAHRLGLARMSTMSCLIACPGLIEAVAVPLRGLRDIQPRVLQRIIQLSEGDGPADPSPLILRVISGYLDAVRPQLPAVLDTIRASGPDLDSPFYGALAALGALMATGWRFDHAAGGRWPLRHIRGYASG